MFKAVLFQLDEVSGAAIESLAVESNQVCVEKVVSRIPEPYELVRTINSYGPDLVFIDVSSCDNALAAAYRVRGNGAEDGDYRIRWDEAVAARTMQGRGLH